MTMNRDADLERTLGEIWCRVLGLASVEHTEEFFGLGGDSLQAMRMLHAVSEAFAVEVPVEALASSPTLADLAARVRALLADAEPTSASTRESGEL